MSGVEQKEPEDLRITLEELRSKERREAAIVHWRKYADPEWKALLEAEPIDPEAPPPFDNTGS